MKLQTLLLCALTFILATLVLAGVLPEHLARTARMVFGVEVLCVLGFVALIHNSQKWQAQKKSLAEAEALQAQSPQPEPAPLPDVTPPAKYGTGIGDQCDTVVRITPDGAKSVIRQSVKPEIDLNLEILKP
jgi:hypothetical protein